MDIHKLVKLVIDNDSLAQKTFIKQYHLDLKRMLIRFTGTSNVEDVLQEAWIKIFRALPSFKFESDIKTWMVRIAVNTSKSYFKKENKHQATETCGLEENYFDARGHWGKQKLARWDIETPEALLECDQLCDLLEQKIETLPENQKLVMILADIEGVKLKEVCHILNLTESNTRMLLHRARQHLLMAINEYYEGKVSC